VAEGVVGLDHVQVAAPAGCEQVARRFYGELLGLDEVAKPESLAAAGGVWFACGAQGLHVGVAEDVAPAAKAHPGLRVADTAALDELAERLRAAGAPVEPDDRLPGHRRFYTRPLGQPRRAPRAGLTSAPDQP
jgi:catechol 2,3-dioxygenase-like lactoylglutathione lyase family enzyme